MNDFNLYEEYEALGESLVPKVLPDAKYTAVVKKAVAGTTDAGKGRIVVTLEIASGPHAGEETVDQLTWSPESEVAARIFSGALAVMGATPDWIKENRIRGFDEVAEKILGAVIEISTKQQEFNGQMRARVTYLKTVSLPDGPPQAAQHAAVPTLGTPPQQPQQPQPQEATVPTTATAGSPAVAASWPTL